MENKIRKTILKCFLCGTHWINSIAEQLLLSRVDVLQEVEHTAGIGRYAVVGPHQEVILEDFPLLASPP